MEAPPSGFVVMEMRVKDARTVEVQWTRPAEENGEIYYDVYCDGFFYANPGREIADILCFYALGSNNWEPIIFVLSVCFFFLCQL